MNSRALLVCMVACVSMLSGCATSRTITLNVPSFDQPPAQPLLQATLPSWSPEQCNNALIAAYDDGTPGRLLECVKFCNGMLKDWPNHAYASNSAYLGGWSMLFLADVPDEGQQNIFDAYDRYIDYLNSAAKLFETSARQDRSTDGHWASASGHVQNVLQEGFRDNAAMEMYLQAQRLIQLKYLKSRDMKDLMDALEVCRRLENKRPEWARRFGVRELRKEVTTALALSRTRQEETGEMFRGDVVGNTTMSHDDE